MLSVVTLIMLGERYKVWKFSFWSLLHSPLIRIKKVKTFKYLVSLLTNQISIHRKWNVDLK